MSLADDTAALERSLKDAGASLDRVLEAASVDRSTWTRWKNGSVRGARYDTIQRVREAARKAIDAEATPSVAA